MNSCLRVIIVKQTKYITIAQVAIRVTKPAKTFVVALHKTHEFTAIAPLQKELGTTNWSRDLRLRPVARVPRRGRRIVLVQILRKGVHHPRVLAADFIQREHEHPTASLSGLVAVRRYFAGGGTVGTNRVHAALGFGVALLDC